ncbi:MAG: TetR/AcrR family transcriptional regulator [Candidatus Marinimicrobia bacterium]|nr:TetR/AcrR family transcriptional regulator [Candidatus Neomarinimicrobiota bacterium]
MNRKLNTRETILNEAIFIASKTGFEALTIGKLSKSVGMSKSGLFAHFNSKEQMQVDILKAVEKKFNDVVITPSLEAPRGEARIRVLAQNLIKWDDSGFMPGGCMLHTASIEFEDRPGPQRDFLVFHQRYWIDFIAKAASLAVEEGHFSDDLDTQLFAFEFHAILQSHHFSAHLLNDPQAESRAMKMVENLIMHSRK